MHGDLAIWQLADECLTQATAACLIVLVDARGTVPNRPGAKLVVAADGRREGTVGGGPSEQTLVERAADMLAAVDRGRSEVVEMEHTEEGTGMLCEGTQTFAVLRLEPEDRGVVADVVEALKQSRRAVLIIDSDGVGMSDETPPEGTPRWVEGEGGWQYIEPLGDLHVVTIVGGGHVSLALSRALDPLGFEVVVLDDRPNLDTMERNTWACARRVIDYARVEKEVPDGDRSYVCIMTFAHERDEEVLEALIGKPLRYLGMMGSPTKVASIFGHLRRSGIDERALARVCAPIGVPIASDTPEEIAASIAAELVAVRNGAPLVWRGEEEGKQP
jgi:xanthine dehydrogenase accessory factor